MLQAIRETVTVEEGGVVRLRSEELSPGSLVDVIVLPSLPGPARRPLSSFRGVAKGVYDNIEEADTFIRSERNQWDR